MGTFHPLLRRSPARVRQLGKPNCVRLSSRFVATRMPRLLHLGLWTSRNFPDSKKPDSQKGFWMSDKHVDVELSRTWPWQSGAPSPHLGKASARGIFDAGRTGMLLSVERVLVVLPFRYRRNVALRQTRSRAMPNRRSLWLRIRHARPSFSEWSCRNISVLSA